MIQVKGHLPPAIIHPPGASYACAGASWVKVEAGTEIKHITTGPTPPKAETFKVEGSKGNSYTVTKLLRGKFSCSCPGFSFRRKCKHIDIVRRAQ